MSSSSAKQSYLPAARGGDVVPITGMNQVTPIGQASPLVPAERFAKLLPKTPTRREKQVGKELAVRAAVMEGHARLHRAGAVVLAQMHDHTHEQVVEGVVGMNARVRAVADNEDRAELAAITAQQKAMFVRHQFALVEAAGYRVAAEVDRELYQSPAQGFLALIRGD